MAESYASATKLLVGITILTICFCAAATAATLRVPADYNDIQAAINAANELDVVEVNDGAYTGPGNFDINTAGKAVTVRSANGPENCIIDCGQKGRAFIFNNAEDVNTIIEGFTILNAYAADTNWPGSVSPEGFGGAIYCEAASPTIRDCIIKWSQADGLGGAIYCADGHPIIQSCQLSHNWALGNGGAIALQDCNAAVKDCTITYNDCWLASDDVNQHGGGIYSQGGRAAIEGCFVRYNNSNNCGGAIAIIRGRASIKLCEITDNDCWASGGGIYVEGNAPADPCYPYDTNLPNCSVTNCVIANNWGYWTGGLLSYLGSLVAVENCTIAYNVVPLQQIVPLVGGLECYDMGRATVKNSIIWANKGEQLVNPEKVTYTDVKMPDSGDPNAPNIWTGEGNINKDPLFANSLNRDYHLKTETPNGRWNPATQAHDSNDPVTSPCINAGDPFSDYSLELDPCSTRINMGAYGNTPQASWSGNVPSVTADINRDGRVNFIDYAILLANWNLTGPAIADIRADVDYDGSVNMADLVILCRLWLWPW